MNEYKPIDDFPDYEVNSKGRVRRVDTKARVNWVRVSTNGHNLVNLRKDGKVFTRSCQNLADAAFGRESPNIYITYEMVLAGVKIGDVIDGKVVIGG